ncbi:glucokinase regulatory protein [Scleropages formosus]|uniref:glucokinase regulatory protein n=1 Tax=Scleropages formosus TaxID=113540 RepID=UPI0010FAA000|nr:glucokinase regulatory protein [Scleropages formosus]
MQTSQIPQGEPMESRKWELVEHEPYLPVTERSNPLTRDIDRADSEHIVHLLKACDAEIFHRDWGRLLNQQTLYSKSIVQTLVQLTNKVEDILKDPEESLVVISGCGTSGRLAFLLARSFNGLLKETRKEQVYSYIIAGGDKALLTSQESIEDNPTKGADVLKKMCEGKKHVLYIGISCGLSAPFIAGQLDFCINNLNVFTPAVVGFNLANMARNEPIPSWHLTFRQVIERMEELQKRKKAFIINPVVGPEAISGSSRLKGGSTTKIILETIFLGAHEAVSAYKRITAEDVMDRIRMYEQVHKITYSQSEMIASLVQQAGDSLRKEGHVYYVGWSTLGIMGIIDASECIPTFGADAKDICGFINQGYNEMKNKDGDLTALGPEFCISHMDFVNTILPSVTELDTVIFLFTQDDGLCEIETLANRTKQRTSNLHAISHDLLGSEDLTMLRSAFASVLNITWTTENYAHKKVMQELSTKWILNAVSTGGHILKGKIFRNYMMDLKVTNSKLFKRAVNILQMITGCLPTVCIRALLQAVYDTEDVTDDMTAAEVTKHTTLAPTRSRVVPTALVILTRNCSLSEAKSLLDAYSLIRDAVEACLTVCEGADNTMHHSN